MPKQTGPSYYAVHVGKTKGIYYTWAECEKQIRGVPAAKFKKFPTLQEAQDFVKNGPAPYPQRGAASSSKARSTSSSSSAASSSASRRTGASKAATAAPSSSSVGTAASSSYTRVGNITVPVSDAIIAYTDGSSRGNGQEGCQAGIGVFFGVNDPRNVSERLPVAPDTNQRAELMAALRAIQVCGNETKPLEIRSDSHYTIQVASTWGPNWVKNGWRKSDGSPVMNRDIIEPLMSTIEKRKGPIKWVYVQAHVGHFGNEMADRLANAGAIMPRSANSEE
ncbi:hypothetical protein DFQ27_002027 [Actinomortierella ambigua]|uniref:Ribonuclease H n=1 Tax=Actinomortierella ambigua TaxID=1343610 RepID=A0A9P6U7M1_9FUNG|nr:hypothetical protein DFQ27_002027 [Actinomortierella ambigua]